MSDAERFSAPPVLHLGGFYRRRGGRDPGGRRMTGSQIATASDLWSSGFDSMDIARLMWLPEATIHNHLLAIRFWRKIA